MFNPGEDAKRLKEALRDPNKEVATVIAILTCRSAQQRQEIVTVYKDQFNKVSFLASPYYSQSRFIPHESLSMVV